MHLLTLYARRFCRPLQHTAQRTAGIASTVVALALALLLGCTPAEDRKTGIIRLNLYSGVNGLDPAYATNQSAVWVVSQLFEGLVRLDSNLAIQPALAKRWALSADGTTYTFTLKPNVRYHTTGFYTPQTNRTVTAADFVYSFTRVCDPKTASPGLWIFNRYLTGVAEYREGKSPSIAGIQAPNDSTLVLRLRAPFRPFLYLLTMPYAAVVNPEAARHFGREFRRNPIGTGAFMLKRFTEGRSLILNRNPQYHIPTLPYEKAVYCRFIPSKFSAFSEFLTGGIDMLEGIDPQMHTALLTPNGQLQDRYRKHFRLEQYPQLTTEYLGLNTQSPALADVRVRRAIALSIDRQAFVRVVLNGVGGTPAQRGFCPPALPGLDSSTVSAGFAPDSAAALLAAAGYAKGKGLPLLNFYTNPNYRRAAEFVQKSLEAVGIQVQVHYAEGSALRALITAGKADLWRASWVADYPDAENFLALFYSPNIPPNGPNTTRYHNPEYDAHYTRAATTQQDSTRTALTHAMEQILAADCPAVYLYYYQTLRLVRNRVKGLPQCASPLVLPLEQVQVLADGS